MNEVLNINIKAEKNNELINSWNGKLLMIDDLCFEGIVTSSDIEDKELILGILINYNLIELLKFNNSTFSANIFSGISDGVKINGEWTIQTPLGTNYLGKCEVLMTSTQMNINDLKKFKESINEFKDNTNLYNKILISNFESTKNDIILDLLKSYSDYPVKQLHI